MTDGKKEIRKFDFESDDLRSYCAMAALSRVIYLTFDEMAGVDTAEAFLMLFETTKVLAEEYGLNIEKDLSDIEEKMKTEFGYVSDEDIVGESDKVN